MYAPESVFVFSEFTFTISVPAAPFTLLAKVFPFTFTRFSVPPVPFSVTAPVPTEPAKAPWPTVTALAALMVAPPT